VLVPLFVSEVSPAAITGKVGESHVPELGRQVLMRRECRSFDPAFYLFGYLTRSGDFKYVVNILWEVEY
jgi:hypothetical protein